MEQRGHFISGISRRREQTKQTKKKRKKNKIGWMDDVAWVGVYLCVIIVKNEKKIVSIKKKQKAKTSLQSTGVCVCVWMWMDINNNNDDKNIYFVLSFSSVFASSFCACSRRYFSSSSIIRLISFWSNCLINVAILAQPKCNNDLISI